MKIALLGYGRMGKTIEKFAQERNHEIVFILDKNEEKGSLAEAEVAINFSVPEAAVKNIKLALGKKFLLFVELQDGLIFMMKSLPFVT